MSDQQNPPNPQQNPPNLLNQADSNGLQNSHPADRISKVINSTQGSQAYPDWANRRKIVTRSLFLFAGFMTVLTAVVTFGYVWEIFTGKAVEISRALSSVAINILWISGMLFASIIGSYVFGSTWDVSSFRSFISKMTIGGGNDRGPGPDQQQP